jgi:hypothetical protein
MNFDDTDTLRQRLIRASIEEIEQLYNYCCLHPVLRYDLSVHDIFLDTNLNLIRDPTFFSNAKNTYHNSELVSQFILKLVAKGYPITGNPLAEKEGITMLEDIIKYGSVTDLSTFMTYKPNHIAYPHLIFVAIKRRPMMVLPLIRAKIQLHGNDSNGDDPLIASIKKFNLLGDRQSLEVPPIMNHDDILDYVGCFRTQETSEIIDWIEEREDITDRLKAIHSLQDALTPTITKRAR